RVSDAETTATIRQIFTTPPSAPYILDPHTAVGIAGALRVIAKERDENHLGPKSEQFISLSTAHPAKFNHAVDLALKDVEGYGFEELVRPKEFLGLEQREKRCSVLDRADKELVKELIDKELEA